MSYKILSLKQKIGLALVSIFALTVVAVAPVPVSATDVGDAAQAAQCQGDSRSCVCPPNQPNCGTDPVFKSCKADSDTQQFKDCQENNDLFKKYVNPFIALLSFAVGLAVVIGIIVGGLQYITSAGDPQKAAAGKKHIWGAIFALIVWLFLFALFNFLIPGGII